MFARKKEYPAPESGRDAAEPAGVVPVCRGGGGFWFDGVSTDCRSVGILIHAGFAAIFPGTARIAVPWHGKNPRPGDRDGGWSGNQL